MIQEFQASNFYSIRERLTLSFVPTTDTEMRAQYVNEVAPGVERQKLGIVYGSNASGKTTILKALSYFRTIMLDKPEIYQQLTTKESRRNSFSTTASSCRSSY